MNIRKLFIACTMHAIVQAQFHNKITGGMRLKSKKNRPDRSISEREKHATRYPAMQLHPQITKEHKAFWSK